MPDACWLVITSYRRKCCRSGNLYFSYFVYRRSKMYSWSDQKRTSALVQTSPRSLISDESGVCEEKRRSDYFPGWVKRYLYLLNSSWLPTNLYFSCLWTNFYFSCLWEKKGGRFIFLVEWKGTCTSSTLAGCRLIFISSHIDDSSERREQWLADENVLVPLQLSANSYVALWSLISDESGVWGGKRRAEYFCHVYLKSKYFWPKNYFSNSNAIKK